MTVDLSDDELLTRDDVNKLIGRSVRQLERDAKEGDGIPYVRIGERQVRYRLGDVRTYVKARTFRSRAAELSQQAA